MGTYLNPGRTLFEEAVRSKIFVDKSEMIQYLNTVVNTKQKYVCVSRPRRFGKTMAADMIAAYYDRTADSRELFSKRKLAQSEPIRVEDGEISWDEYLGKFDVLRLVMTRFLKSKLTVAQSLENMQKLVIRELQRAYPEIDFFSDEDLMQAIDDVYSENERQIVIIIDEWDAVFRERKEDKEGQTEYLDFFRDLIKDNKNIALAYLTGILPIKKYGKHSALNMFDEYSMMAPMQLAPYTGFTENEVLELCREFGRDFEQIKEWYDGYTVSSVIPQDPDYITQKTTGAALKAECFALYNPLSVVKAIQTGFVKNYWNKTETYEALAEYIRMDYDGLKEAIALLMDGGRRRVDTSTYQNDMTTFHGRDDVLSLLIHLGYLGFDDKKGEVFIPNQEILDEFKTSTKSPEWLSAFKSFDLSEKLLKATWEKDETRVAELLEDFHNRAANRTYNDEAALSYGIQLAYYAAQKYYTTILELDSGKGYADIIYLPSPKHPEIKALLIELKHNKNADTALSQIKRQKYPERLDHYKGNLLLVAINYDKDVESTSIRFKRHSCKIEEA